MPQAASNLFMSRGYQRLRLRNELGEPAELDLDIVIDSILPPSTSIILTAFPLQKFNECQLMVSYCR
jgi:hypothetical protein